MKTDIKSFVNIKFMQKLMLYTNKKNLFSLREERSSRPEVFCKKGLLRNFAKFTEKHLC